MQVNEGPKGQNATNWRPTRLKWKEMKAQKSKMKGTEGPQGQNERKWSPKIQNERTWPKWKEMKPKKLKWREMKAQEAKMTGNGGCVPATPKQATLRPVLRFGVTHSRASCRLQRVCRHRARAGLTPGRLRSHGVSLRCRRSAAAGIRAAVGLLHARPQSKGIWRITPQEGSQAMDNIPPTQVPFSLQPYTFLF